MKIEENEIDDKEHHNPQYSQNLLNKNDSENYIVLQNSHENSNIPPMNKKETNINNNEINNQNSSDIMNINTVIDLKVPEKSCNSEHSKNNFEAISFACSYCNKNKAKRL